ncbi:condensation domain-containing protein [Streptomyces griseus]|uniref:Condensation domain-containing protein n=3 Tax=Streptomyces TaxID=1883 RepID=A0ABU2W4S7_9ACTN|nr:condensation domain-containing protein [Streptomyces griseus]MDT0492863.1 condensation domain-containing protein [Streptomyces griseus]
MGSDTRDSTLDADRARLVTRQVEEAVRQQPHATDCAVVLHGAEDPDSPAPAELRCVNCGIGDAFPGLAFDSGGVCSLCARLDAHREEIQAYFRQPEELAPRLRGAARARGADIDCLLLFSGGKDSTYVLYRLVELGLRVMTFTFDNGFISRTALRNVEDVTSELGIEHVTATRADQRTVFLRSLQEHKSVCNGCFRSLLDLSTTLAHERGIPSIVTGLSRGQIMDERLSWFHEHGVYDVAEIEEKLRVGRRVYHQASGDLGAAVDSVDVVDFFRYSEVTKEGIRAYLRQRSSLWAQPTDTGFCSSNCMINDVGVYVHAAERGYHNYEAPTRWEVRLGHLDRAEADEELRVPVDTERVRRMLARIGYPDPADLGRLGARMTAYYVPAPGTAAQGLPGAVAGVLPESLLPATWVPVPRIPRTAGRVDRRALLALRTVGPSASRAPEAGGVPPAGGPLLAVQQRLLRQHTEELKDHARALPLTAPGVLDPAAVRRAVLRLLQHHDALRLRFAESEGRWSQRRGGIAGAVPVGVLDLTGRDPADEARLLGKAVDRMRAGTDPVSGRPLRIAVLDRRPRPSGLLVVVHGLVADTRSWRVLLEDLSEAVRQLQAGEAVALPPAGSFLDRLPPHDPAPASASQEAAATSPGEPRTSRAPLGEPLRVHCDATVPARAAATAIQRELTRLFDGAGQPLELLDHTARSGEDRTVGPLTAPETVRVGSGAGTAGSEPVTTDRETGAAGSEPVTTDPEAVPTDRETGPTGPGAAPGGSETAPTAPETTPAGSETAPTAPEPVPPSPPAAHDRRSHPPHRYEHFGDLSAELLAPGTLWALAPGAEDTFTRPLGGLPEGVVVTGSVRGGRLVLDWWAAEPLRTGLRAAGVPERVAARLAAGRTQGDGA